MRIRMNICLITYVTHIISEIKRKNIRDKSIITSLLFKIRLYLINIFLIL